VVGGLVDEHMLLTREEPGQGAGRELVATFAQQIGGRAAHDQVDLELGVPVGARAQVTCRVSNHPSVDAGPKAEVLDHRKKG
jgi:hypothetical protein